MHLYALDNEDEKLFFRKGIEDKESPYVYLKLVNKLPDNNYELSFLNDKKAVPILYKGTCVIGIKCDKKYLNTLSKITVSAKPEY